MQTNQCAQDVDPFPYEASNVLLGRGGSGAVFLARTIGSHDLVAIKRQYTRSGHGSNVASPPNRASSVVRRIESIVEQRSQQSSTTATSAGSSSSQTITQLAPHPISAFAREMQNEEDVQEESNMEVMAWHREEASQPFSPMQVPSDGNPSDEEAQLSTGSENELQILQHVGFHPHIVQCLGDFKSARNVSFLALQLMDTDVAKEVQKGNVDLMQEDVCRVVMFSVLLALDFIHGKGVAHRDVKPGNLLLKVADKDNSVFIPTATDGSPHASPTKSKKPYQVSLGDFSAAHFVNRVTDKCIAANRGTLYYKAPEQLLSKDIQSYAACDMWALGCTMFEMATGTVAFFGKTELQVQLQIFHRMGSNFDTYPFQTAAPLLFDSMTVSPAFHDLLQHLLVLNPQTRYTAKEALLHPFFAGVRAKYNEATARLGRPATMSFPLRLLTASTATQSKKLGLVFTPINPMARPKRRTEPRKGTQGAHAGRSSISPIPMKRSSTVQVQSPESAGQNEPEGHYSFLSDGTSVHWSQIRSMIGDSSSFMDTSGDQQRPSGESPAPVPQQRGREGRRGSGGAAVFSAVRRLPTPSKNQSAPTTMAGGQETGQGPNNNNNDVSPGSALSGSGIGSDNSFALPRVTFSSEARTLSVDRDHSSSLRSASHKSDENEEGNQKSMPPTATSPTTSTGAAQPRRARTPVLQQPAKSISPATTTTAAAALLQRASPLDTVVTAAPGVARSGHNASAAGPGPGTAAPHTNAAAEALPRPHGTAPHYRGLFLSGDGSSRDDEERPSSSEQGSQTHLTAGSPNMLTATGSHSTTSHAFKSLQFESPRPSSGGGSSTDGSSARFTATGTATNTVRPAMRPFVAPGHAVAGRTSSRHRHSGRRGHDPACETPSGRSEFMVSCCSTVSCSPFRGGESGRAAQSSRSETGSFFSDPALLATAPPPLPQPPTVAIGDAVIGLSQPSPQQQQQPQPMFPLPILLSHSMPGDTLDTTTGRSVGATAAPATPYLPLFMPTSTATTQAQRGPQAHTGVPVDVSRVMPRPVALSDVSHQQAPVLASAVFPTTRTALADLTNCQGPPPPQYDLFCASSRYRRLSTSAKLGAGGGGREVGDGSSRTGGPAMPHSPNPRMPTTSTNSGTVSASTPQSSIDRDTSKKRPREEDDDVSGAPVLRL